MAVTPDASMDPLCEQARDHRARRALCPECGAALWHLGDPCNQCGNGMALDHPASADA